MTRKPLTLLRSQVDKLDEMIAGRKDEVAVCHEERCAVLGEQPRVCIELTVPRQAEREELSVVHEAAGPWQEGGKVSGQRRLHAARDATEPTRQMLGHHPFG